MRNVIKGFQAAKMGFPKEHLQVAKSMFSAAHGGPSYRRPVLHQDVKETPAKLAKPVTGKTVGRK